VVLLDPPPPANVNSVKVFGQNCPNGRCVAPSLFPVDSGSTLGTMAGADPIGNPPTNNHEWGQFKDGGWGWKLKLEKPAVPEMSIPLEVGDVADQNFGVVKNKIHTSPTYSISGVEVTRAEVRAAFGGSQPLTDDSDRWHFTVVGDDAFKAAVKVHVEKLEPSVKAKLLIQYYSKDNWAVTKFSLPQGVSLRRPSELRTSEQVGVVAQGDYSLEKLLELLKWLNGDPKPQPPMPTPVLPVTPNPNQPQPAPVDPVPTPAPTNPNWPMWVALALGALYFLFPKKVN